MLRKIIDFHLSLAAEGKPLAKLRPLFNALDTFFYETPLRTRKGPHIRDSIDLKRWMLLVVFALIPVTLMAVWNTGLQKYVYGNGNFEVLNEYLSASHSIPSYFSFAFQEGRYLTILKYGLQGFLPILIISYAVGGFWEGLFAVIRRHEISEGFLVTGILYALILPSTIPYWMVVVGVSTGIVISKEIFGGTGMNILNPALVCRCFLFFTFPAQMTGNIWVGSNPTQINTSVVTMIKDADLTPLDGYSTQSMLNIFNVSPEIKRIHVDAIAAHQKIEVSTLKPIKQQFEKWNTDTSFEDLTPLQLQSFVSTPLNQGGLGLSEENYPAAYHFAKLRYGQGILTDGNFFFGNMVGSMGETSTLACILGAFLLISTGIGSWRSMLAMGIGAYVLALIFQFGAEYVGADQGAWNPAKFALPAYKHLILGSLAFGLVFMITDPVSSPSLKRSRWKYGLLIGALVIIIRVINPAFSEGVMLAILFGNVFAPLMDHHSLKQLRKRRLKDARKAIQ